MMHDFKVGDTVVRTLGQHGGMLENFTDVIIDVREYPWGRTRLTLKEYGSGHSADNFRVIKYVDDLLPPVPDSVHYVGFATHKYRELRVQQMSQYIDINAGDGRGNTKSVTLDPDSALQLAHDLTRMAMELKRKQDKY